MDVHRKKRSRQESESDDTNEEEHHGEVEYPFFIEEESESEPELECDIWDVDCRIIDRVQSSLVGFHLMPTCCRNPDDNLNKKYKMTTEIRQNLVTEDFKRSFKEKWTENNGHNDEDFEIITDPFKVCVVNNFLENPKLLDELRQEFYELDWNLRAMDLYEFFQSKDLKYLTNYTLVNQLHEFLANHVRDWVSTITGCELDHISSTCSFYGNTDYLLVHDDRREDRMIAFILYFTGKEGWSESKGGALQLYSKDENGQPLKTVRDIYPVNNRLIFFPVTNESYHQVAEVTSLNECRMSINGWFHTKNVPNFDSPMYTTPQEGLFGPNTIKPIKVDIELSSWLNEDYLDCQIMSQIQEYFGENSEISLKDFFKPNSFDEISNVLIYSDLNWTQIGPPNRMKYEILKNDDLPFLLERFFNLFQSEQMYALLRRLTALDLKCLKYELQKWTPGCYSLLSDHNWIENKELDLIISFGCKDNRDVIGARTQYVTLDEEVQNALITIDPQENHLNVIYRDTARFTNYYSKQSKCQCFFTFIVSYSE